MDHNNNNLVVDTATMDPIIASYFRTHFSPSPSSRPTNVPTTLGQSEVDSLSQPERQQRRRRTSHTSSPHTANDRGRPSLRRGSHRKPAPAAIATPTFSFFSKCSSKKSSAETPSSAATSPSASSTSSTFNNSSTLSTSPSSTHQPQFLGPRAWQSQYAGVYAAMQFAPRSAFSASTESDAEDDDEEQQSSQTQPHDLKDDDQEQLSNFPFPSPPSSVSTPAMPSTPTRSEEGGYMELLEGDFVEKARLALERREVTFGRRSVDK